MLDIFFVRFPFGDPEINGSVWREIDEQQIPAPLRQRLAHNGFRAGVVGGQIPIALSKLLELEDKPVATGQPNETNLAGLEETPRVMRRHLQIRKGQRSEILSSGLREELAVLLFDREGLCGDTYNMAQAVWAAKAFPQDDGRVELHLTPELHHDEARQRWVGSQGMLRLETARPRRVFDDMTLSPTLSPGDMLVLSSLPNRQGSLGHHFFTEDHDKLEQKLLIIRLSQTQHDELFNPSEPLDLSAIVEE